VDFLKELLEHNRYTVRVVPSAPPKAAPGPAVANEPEAGTAFPAAPPLPASFTVGVTDVTFNPVNALFGRSLKTKEGRVVTLAFWQQKEAASHDEIPYFERRIS
jgi:hypothetical protein